MNVTTSNIMTRSVLAGITLAAGVSIFGSADPKKSSDFSYIGKLAVGGALVAAGVSSFDAVSKAAKVLPIAANLQEAAVIAPSIGATVLGVMALNQR